MNDIFEPCIYCEMRSYVFIELPSGKDISVCGHHFQANEQSLRNAAVTLIDLRDTIPA